MKRLCVGFAATLLLVGCGINMSREQLPDVKGIEVDVTDDNFSEEVLSSTQPVLVDFNATWCGPCREMEPVLAHLSLNYEGRLKVAKLDVDDNPATAEKYNISAIPALVLIHGGQEVDRVTGSRSLSSLSSWVDARIPEAAETKGDVKEKDEVAAAG